MIYRVIGLMSGSSLDGLDIAFVELEERAGKWNFSIRNTECIDYDQNLRNRLAEAVKLSAFEFSRLNKDFGRFMGLCINNFIEKNGLNHQIQLIVSHGHTIFHEPAENFTTQIGDGAQIAALTGINVVDQLRSLDVALGGQGAPIVPIGEKFLFSDYHFFLNLGGIANLSIHLENNISSFDVCIANQCLNHFAKLCGKMFDEDGKLASYGQINTALLTKLNQLDYYHDSYPKSLSNNYFTNTILPFIQSFQLSNEDILCTYTEHIVAQIAYALSTFESNSSKLKQLFITGGGALNQYLILRLQSVLASLNFEIIIPDLEIVQFKEAIIMAFIGIKRWREENTVIAGSTGSIRPSIGGAVWIGQQY